MDQQQIVEALAERAKSLGLPMYEVCRRAGVAASTPSRWRKGHNGLNLSTLGKLNAVLDAVAQPTERAEQAA